MRRRQCHAQVSAEEGEPPYYLIEYTVESSRGRKVYVCKYCIFNKRLYVLQAQAKQDTFDAKDEVGGLCARGAQSGRVFLPSTRVAGRRDRQLKAESEDDS